MKKSALFLLATLPFAGSALAGDYTLKVDGLMCQHCADQLEGKLKAMEGVEAVTFDLGEKEVSLDLAEGKTLQEEQVRATVKDAGFTLIEVVEPTEKKS